MNWWVNIGIPANLKAALRSNEQGATTDADITYDSAVLLDPRRKPENELSSELPRLRLFRVRCGSFPPMDSSAIPTTPGRQRFGWVSSREQGGSDLRPR